MEPNFALICQTFSGAGAGVDQGLLSQIDDLIGPTSTLMYMLGYTNGYMITFYNLPVPFIAIHDPSPLPSNISGYI